MSNLTYELNEELSGRVTAVKSWSDIEAKRYESAIENAKTPKELAFAMMIPVLGFDILDIADTKFEEMTEEDAKKFDNCFGNIFEGTKVNGMDAKEWAKMEEER